ncbi:MAG TPA: ATP-binding protein [Allosphingosinicella sp.]|nr:ATP-binding protein [Allosphingosinicella sp.]
MTINANTKAVANPTKAFFVTMITRDITLEDCILDLIDNSVDGAWRSEGSRPVGLAEGVDLSAYSIDINATPDSFCIKDNCGGMTLDDAIDHAFSFGRPAMAEHDDYSIGVYGIGMKRAVFKLGTEIRIRSTYLREDGVRESFAVPINVTDWLGDDQPPWDFDIVEDESLAEDGVNIQVTELTPGAKGAFDSPAFIQNLRRTIARDYSLHLNRGLVISLNGTAIPGWQIELLQGTDFAPMRVEYPDEVNGDEVSVEIIGGMAAPPPESADPDISDEGEKRFGWYVICNGRIVLAADKTAVSGWGSDEWPQWHRQYSGFVGIILFTAANAAALPMTTTKRSVDTSSEVYRRARPQMREVTRKWIDYTNMRKQALEEARRVEATAGPVSLYAVRKQQTVTLPRLVARPVEPVANVNYAVPVARLKRLAKELGSIRMPYREVGLKSFDYAYDDLVGDE